MLRYKRAAPLHLQPHLQVLGTQQLAGLGEVYAERFRKQKLRWAGCGMTSDQEASQVSSNLLGLRDPLLPDPDTPWIFKCLH